MGCCFGRSDREADVSPNRPVSIEKTDTKSKPKMGKDSQPTYQPPTNDTAGFSTADEKRNVFGPASHDSGPSGSAAINTIPPYLNDQEQKKQPYQDTTAAEPMPTENPPPYHNWQEAVPDTSILPPPPVQAYLYSNTGNALEEDADRAHEFCDNTPLWTPCRPSPSVYSCVQNGDLRPVQPHEYHGSLGLVGNGRWKGQTNDNNGDCLLLTSLPVYFPVEDSPLATERSRTIYFEVKLLGLYGGTPTQTSGFSIGFAAQPYPTWRSPGWERGSIGVFSDDGCRFINDSWGGKEFTTEFEVGETVGLGMTFSLSPDTLAGTAPAVIPGTSRAPPPLAVEVFFTRNGGMAGSWNLHEEADEESGSVEGLEGDFDLYGALGLFGGVEFEVCFDRSGWLYQPPTGL